LVLTVSLFDDLVLNAVILHDLDLHVLGGLGLVLKVINFDIEFSLALNELQELVSSEEDTLVASVGKEESSVVDLILAIASGVHAVHTLVFAVNAVVVLELLLAFSFFLALDLVPVSGLLGVFLKVLNLSNLKHDRDKELVHLGHLFLLEISDFFHGLIHIHLDLARLGIELLSLGFELMHVGEDLLTSVMEIELLFTERLNGVNLEVTVSKLL
jgi:hypothetical protein